VQSSNPLIVQSDLTVLLEVDSPRYLEARGQLGKFAELVKMPEHVHTYRITSLSLWNACAVGLEVESVVDALADFAKYPPPQSVAPQLREMAGRFGALRLERLECGGLGLRVLRPGLVEELSRHASLKNLLGALAEPGVFAVEAPWRGPLKRTLAKLGWPVEDRAGFTAGAVVPMALREKCLSGKNLRLRDYQTAAVSHFQEGNLAGAGVVVLPCGGGKTLVGLACMVELGMQTLILASSVTAARQWKQEILDKTTLSADDVGEYSGERKEIKPVTIATYQVLTHRETKPRKGRGDSEPELQAEPATPPGFSHFGLFDAHNWGLVIYDEVHLLPAPLFQASASIQARRRLGLTATLIREDGLETDVFALIGPKLFDIPWRELEGAGWIAPALCTEIRIPMPEHLLLDYATCGTRQQPQVAAANPSKSDWARTLLELHPGEPALIIGTYLEPLKRLAEELAIPLMDGSLSHARREALFADFRAGKFPVLAVSKVANSSIDLPDASVAIQISGQFGSRQEEAQRLGRILRPKEGRRAYFYTLVTADTVEQDFALRRQLFLCEQGYEYRLLVADAGPPNLALVRLTAENL
jgi:DNA excision repair protein ERCC-3